VTASVRSPEPKDVDLAGSSGKAPWGGDPSGYLYCRAADFTTLISPMKIRDDVVDSATRKVWSVVAPGRVTKTQPTPGFVPS